MVKSMTGYGRARQMRSGRDITVEVRSVNNRYLDCTVKMPRAYIFAEDAIKSRVQKAVSRGKVDVFITIDATGADETVVTVNEALARGYYDALMRLKDTFGLEGRVTPDMLAKFPDVLTVTKAEEDVDAIAADICAVLEDALAAYNGSSGAMPLGTDSITLPPTQALQMRVTPYSADHGYTPALANAVGSIAAAAAPAEEPDATDLYDTWYRQYQAGLTSRSWPDWYKEYLAAQRRLNSMEVN